MRNIIPLFVLVCGLTLSVRAQQLPVLTQYMFNQMAFNPAYAGTGGGICVNGLFRQQWIGFKDNEGNRVLPQTILLTVDAPLKFLHGALGGSIISDQVGFFENIGVKVGYAFRTDLGAGEFSAGIQAHLINYRIDFARFQGHLIDDYDDVFNGKFSEQSDLTIDADLGIYYEFPEKYYIGFSTSQIFQSKARNTSLQQRRIYFLTGGYNWMIPNHPDFELKPSALLVYDGGAFGANIAALVAYKKRFWGGLVGRFYPYDNIVGILAGANIKSFRVGLSYDVSLSSMNRFSNGTIEVMLGYCFKIEVEKYRMRYKNTRFL